MPAFRATGLVVCELVAALQATAPANVLEKRCKIDFIGEHGPCPHDKATPPRRDNRHYIGLTELATHGRAPSAGATG